MFSKDQLRVMGVHRNAKTASDVGNYGSVNYAF